MAENQADAARKRAEEQREKQEQAEKERAEKEAQAKKEAPGGAAGGDESKLVPKTDPEAASPDAYLARIDSLERLVKTLTAQMAGSEGPKPTETKDITVAGPGAQFDPRLQRPGLGGVTSGPSNQPLPMSAASVGVGPAPDGLAAWGYDPNGNKVTAKVYPQLTEEDIYVRRTAYYDDVIRNDGDIIRGYTGPAASWFIPLDAMDDEKMRKRWDNLFNGRVDEGERAR